MSKYTQEKIQSWIEKTENKITHNENSLRHMRENQFLPWSINEMEKEIQRLTGALNAYKDCYLLFN